MQFLRNSRLVQADGRRGEMSAQTVWLINCRVTESESCTKGATEMEGCETE